MRVVAGYMSVAAAEHSIVSDDPLPDDFTAAREDDFLGGVGDNLDLDLVGMVGVCYESVFRCY